MPPKNCLPTQIINPVTGRCVKKDGKIGKQIVAVQSTLTKTNLPLKVQSPSPILMDLKILRKQAKKIYNQMTVDFLKLSEDEQLKALDQELIRDMIDLTMVFVKTPFSSVWKLLLDKHRDTIYDSDLFDDLSLDQDRRLELIYTSGTQADCNHIFTEIYDLAYHSDKIFKLAESYTKEILHNDTYIGEITDINTYTKLMGVDQINLYDLVFKVRNETFTFLLKKYSQELSDLDVAELKHIINKPDGTNKIPMREKNQRLNEIIKLQH